MSRHRWVTSTLGHGHKMCKHCSMTLMEATVLGDECTKAPPPRVIAQGLMQIATKRETALLSEEVALLKEAAAILNGGEAP